MKDITLHKNNPNNIHNRIIAIWVRHVGHEITTQLMLTPQGIDFADQPFRSLYKIYPQ